LRKKNRHERKAVISIYLTENQKNTLEELISEWDIDMALAGRRLIQYLINNKTTLEELLKKYHAEYPLQGHKNSRPKELRTRRICIRLNRDEKQKLSILADEGFYLPGEAARILMELFIMGVIKKSDIWE